MRDLYFQILIEICNIKKLRANRAYKYVYFLSDWKTDIQLIFLYLIKNSA